jgi:hypothetical protein
VLLPFGSNVFGQMLTVCFHLLYCIFHSNYVRIIRGAVCCHVFEIEIKKSSAIIYHVMALDLDQHRVVQIKVSIVCTEGLVST